MWQVVETRVSLSGESYGEEYEIVRAVAESTAEIERLRVEVYRMDVELWGEGLVDRLDYRVQRADPGVPFRPSVGTPAGWSSVEAPEL
jgi:hypothetical protein